MAGFEPATSCSQISPMRSPGVARHRLRSDLPGTSFARQLPMEPEGGPCWLPLRLPHQGWWPRRPSDAYAAPPIPRPSADARICMPNRARCQGAWSCCDAYDQSLRWATTGLAIRCHPSSEPTIRERLTPNLGSWVSCAGLLQINLSVLAWRRVRDAVQCPGVLTCTLDQSQAADEARPRGRGR